MPHGRCEAAFFYPDASRVVRPGHRHVIARPSLNSHRDWPGLSRRSAVASRSAPPRIQGSLIRSQAGWRTLTGHAMKFILVNHRTPHGVGSCTACSRSLGPGYVRDVVTRRGYCDYNCYRCYHLTDIAFHYRTTCAFLRHDTRDLIPVGFAALMAAASCWLHVGVATMSWINMVARPANPSKSERPPSA